MLPEKQFEADQPESIEALKERIEKLEARIEKEKLIIPEEKEKMVRREIKEYLQELQGTPVAPTATAPPAATTPLASRDEVEEIKKFPTSQQAGILISLVFEKGLIEAINVAKDLNNPAVLDEFHDILIDRYYQSLIKKGILKKI